MSALGVALLVALAVVPALLAFVIGLNRGHRLGIRNATEACGCAGCRAWRREVHARGELKISGYRGEP